MLHPKIACLPRDHMITAEHWSTKLARTRHPRLVIFGGLFLEFHAEISHRFAVGHTHRSARHDCVDILPSLAADRAPFVVVLNLQPTSTLRAFHLFESSEHPAFAPFH